MRQSTSIVDILASVDDSLTEGRGASSPAVPTGFTVLDTYLGGGARGGELLLLGGPQGVGKTFFALQMLRSVAKTGRGAVYVTFEHDTTTVLARLLAAEAGEAVGAGAVGLQRIRRALEATDGGRGGLELRLSGQPGALEAAATLRSYGQHFFVHSSTGAPTDLTGIETATRDAASALGQPPLVVVDYLQKVAVPAGSDVESERVTHVVEGLKDLALRMEVPILAIVAADKDGLGSGTRLRTHHLRGSSALAYEPDVVLVLQDKYDVVAHHHLSFDVGNAERFRAWAILSIEKNRSGLDNVDVEFAKRLDQGRFESAGRPVQETLVDGRVFAH